MIEKDLSIKQIISESVDSLFKTFTTQVKKSCP